jgi:hypothetical protein
MWIAIGRPSRFVAAADTPRTTARTASPGYSIGRKWMNVKSAAVAATATGAMLYPKDYVYR